MFKTVTLLKRKAGMSMAEFIDYYETSHARIGEKYLAAGAIRYARYFLHPAENPVESADSGAPDDKPYDVVTEIWFPDRAAFEQTMARLGEPGPAAEISADEERLFDRARNRFFVVEEHVSDLAAARRESGGSESLAGV
ncbi:MAG: EthD domain-containing protein [Sphingomonadaceae bacterium]